MNLFFYPDDSEIIVTWNQFKFQVFLSHQDRKTNSFVCFLGEVMARQFLFQDLLTNLSCFNHIKSKDFIITIETIYMISFWCPHLNLTAATDRGAVHLWSSFLQNWLTQLTHIWTVSQAETVITVLWTAHVILTQFILTNSNWRPPMGNAKAADFHF